MFPPNTRILIVDDIASLRDILKAYLRRLGFKQISEAEDGELAYQSLITAKTSGAPFELVISDWNMPNMDGLSLLKKVRSIPEWKTLPFLLLTTESEKNKVLEAVIAKVDNYMVKPVEEEMLKEKLLKVWDRVESTK